jgi:uncharacterized protein YegP (UPF0339 family)
MSLYFELRRDSIESFSFSLKTDQKKELLKSKSYATKALAEAAVSAVKQHAPTLVSYRRGAYKNLSVFFQLVTSYGEVIATSSDYTSMFDSESALRMVFQSASSAQIIDLSI